MRQLNNPLQSVRTLESGQAEQAAVQRSRLLRANMARTKATAARRRVDKANAEAASGGTEGLMQAAVADGEALKAKAAATRAEAVGALEQAHRPLDAATPEWWKGI